MPASNVFIPPEPKPEKEKEVKPIIEEPEIIKPPTLLEEQERIQTEGDLLANIIRENVNQIQIDKPYPVPIIKSLNAFGQVEVLFTKPLQKISDRIDLT